MKVILSGVVGSRAYGLSTPESDTDMKGVFVADLREAVGLNGPEVLQETRKLHDGDSEYHEVFKYLKLALKCNPTILEMAYLNDYETLTYEGAMIVNSRSYFLSEPAIRGAYGAYAKQQAVRLIQRNAEGKEGFSSDVRNRTEKHARHCMRLLHQGSQLLKDGTMNVDVSDIKDYLFDMGRLAANSPLDFYEAYLEQAAKFDAVETKLPHSPNREPIDDLLAYIRLGFTV